MTYILSTFTQIGGVKMTENDKVTDSDNSVNEQEKIEESKVEEPKVEESKVNEQEKIEEPEVNTTFKYDPLELKPHPKNVELYGKEKADSVLKESIRELGQLEPIVIDQMKRIVSGHRRWKAIKEINKEEEQKKKENKPYKFIKAICFMKAFSFDIDEEEAIVEFNKHRKKNPLQIFMEVELLEDIYNKRDAEARKLSKLKQNSVNSDLSYRKEEYGSTNEKQAKVIGISEGSLSYLKYIGRAYTKKDKDAKYIMDKMKDGELTIDAGYKYLKLMEAAKDPTPDATQKEKDISAKAKEYIDKIKNESISPSKASKEFEKYKEGYTQKALKTYAKPPEGVFNVIVTDVSGTDAAKKYKSQIPNDAALFLWANTKNIEDRIGLLREWGFSLKSIMIYGPEDKPGVYFNGVVEFVLFGLNGNLEPKEDIHPNIVFTKGEKEGKNTTLYQIAMKMFPGQHYADPFNDTKLEGWGHATREEVKEEPKEEQSSCAF